MALKIATNTNTNVNNGVTLTAGDALYVPEAVSIYATGPTFSGIAGSTGSLDVLGAVLGSSYGINLVGSGPGDAQIFIGSKGSVISGGSDSGGGVGAGQLGDFTLVNLGLIKGSNTLAVNFGGIGTGLIDNSGMIVGGISQATVGSLGATFTLFNRVGATIIGDYDGGVGIGSEREIIVNDGAISGKVSLGDGIGSTVVNTGSMGDLVLGDGFSVTVQNYGTMGRVTFGSGSNIRATNAGQINGVVTLGNGAKQVFDSTLGTVFNQSGTVFNVINAGSGGDTIVGALNGSTINGGAGNDVLIANQTADSVAEYNATNTLDGRGGTNALYGGGGLNTFLAGNSSGGFNQVWGGHSLMNGIDGYANNTLSFAPASAGVFVDLLNGHNAYVGSNASQEWSGVGTLEDSIADVPNVIGSAFGDVIIADNGIDGITGGAGADALYAGSGASSQDAFIYAAYADSNVVNGYDTIVGFNQAADKIDLSAFHTDFQHVAIDTDGTSNSVYLMKTIGTFNPATDLAIDVNTTAAGGLTQSNFTF